MNPVATIVEFKRYKGVTFYSLQFEGEKDCVTEKFFARVLKSETHVESSNRLATWIREIGENRKADIGLFRDERNAMALPPTGRKMRKKDYVKDVRLYCYWVSEEIVILFSGGIKTANAAEKCPNVSMHLHNANKWAKQLKDLGIEHNGKDITNIEELIIS